MRVISIIQDVVINHSSKEGIRGQVWIDHLPIKYYVPAGSQQGQLRNGPYRGNLGDYQSTVREDNDNPLAPGWFRPRQASDPDGVVPLTDPRTGQTVPSPATIPAASSASTVARSTAPVYHQEGSSPAATGRAPPSRP
jgi:hypothetical protein